MADLNHKSKAELAQQIEDLKREMTERKAGHEHMLKMADDADQKAREEAAHVLKRATDKIAAYEQQMDMANREINRLNVMLRELMNQRDQARQALVEGTINSNRLVHYVQAQQPVKD